MYRCVICYWQYCITDSHTGAPLELALSVFPPWVFWLPWQLFSLWYLLKALPEPTCGSPVWQKSLCCQGVVCSSSWCTYTPWCTSAPHRGLWNCVMYCFYVPKCISPKLGLRKGLQTQGHAYFFPQKNYEMSSWHGRKAGSKDTRYILWSSFFAVEGR